MFWKKGKIKGVAIKPIVKHADKRGWLVEIFRSDEMSKRMLPAMGYVSVTKPGVARGPHEHVKQTDIFCFVGPGNFRVMLWDNRKKSGTYGTKQVLDVGESNPVVMTVPPGIVHGYRNISRNDAMMFNIPNRLFAGKGKKQPVDEIRHENNKNSPFIMDG